MGKTGKISPLTVELTGQRNFEGGFKTLSGALAEKGYRKYPGIPDLFQVHRERNGDYRTGLDPNALYIQYMERNNPEEAEQEKKRVTEMRDRLQNVIKDLSPTSAYYASMWDNDYGKDIRARLIKNKPGNPIILDLTNPYDEITYAWLRVHPDVAPSFDFWQRGISTFRCPEISKVLYFLDDEDVTAEYLYKQKKTVNGAIALLDDMTPTKMYQVGRLLGQNVQFYDKPEVLYNILDKFVKSTENNSGNKFENVNKFTKVATMSDENMKVRFLLEEALSFSIYREQKNGRIYHGEVEVGKDKEAAIEHLSSEKFQEDLILLEDLVRQAKEKHSV